MLFYHAQLNENEVILDADESGHLVRVLRKKNGDLLRVTDGKGTIAEAVITNADQRKCRIEIRSRAISPPDTFYIHIAISPTKNIDRLGWFVEKAVEIGIHEISFPICRHSERTDVKTDKIKAKAISAMKQSLTPFLPKINEAVIFTEFLQTTDKKAQNFIAHLADSPTPQLISLAKKSNQYCVLIGPEGDFDPLEVDAAVRTGFEMIKMGDKRLRTETAALHACSLLNGVNYHYLKYS